MNSKPLWEYFWLPVACTILLVSAVVIAQSQALSTSKGYILTMTGSKVNLRDETSNHGQPTKTQVMLSMTPPTPPTSPSLPKGMQNAMVVQPPPVKFTNTTTLAWWTGVGKSNSVAWIQWSTSVATGWSNLMSFPMDGRNVTNNFLSVGQTRFFRFSYDTNNLAR